MDEVRTAFAVLVAEPPVPPEPIEELTGRADRLRRRRTRGRRAGGAVALIVVTVLGATTLVATRPDDVGLSTEAPATFDPAESGGSSVSTEIPVTTDHGDPTPRPGSSVSTLPFTPPPGFEMGPNPGSPDSRVGGVVVGEPVPAG